MQTVNLSTNKQRPTGTALFLQTTNLPGIFVFVSFLTPLNLPCPKHVFLSLQTNLSSSQVRSEVSPVFGFGAREARRPGRAARAGVIRASLRGDAERMGPCVFFLLVRIDATTLEQVWRGSKFGHLAWLTAWSLGVAQNFGQRSRATQVLVFVSIYHETHFGYHFLSSRNSSGIGHRSMVNVEDVSTIPARWFRYFW